MPPRQIEMGAEWKHILTKGHDPSWKEVYRNKEGKFEKGGNQKKEESLKKKGKFEKGGKGSVIVGETCWSGEVAASNLLNY